MAEHTLESALAYDESVLERITARTSGLSADVSTRLPAGGGWSVAGHLEHVTSTTESIVGLVEKLLARLEANPPGAGAQSAPALRLDDLLERSAREKYEAAEASKPKGNLAVPDALARLAAAHRRLEDLRGRLAVVPLHAISFPHRIFGPLSLGQWIAFVGVHEERHLGHIETLLMQ
jgi:hypothetical protein